MKNLEKVNLLLISTLKNKKFIQNVTLNFPKTMNKKLQSFVFHDGGQNNSSAITIYYIL